MLSSRLTVIVNSQTSIHNISRRSLSTSVTLTILRCTRTATRAAPPPLTTVLRALSSKSPFSLDTTSIERVTYNLPQSRRNKVVTAEDAVSLVSSGDTITCSGFVCQGTPEHLLKALGDAYRETGEPHSLTLLFGGGPGDYGERGLNHLAQMSCANDPSKPPMLR